MMSPGEINVLVCCEHTGAIAQEFERRGFNVTSCDLKKRTSPGNHYQGNVFDLVPGSFDVLIGFPPCTYLANSGLHLNNSVPGRFNKTLSAAEFVKNLFSLPIQFIALENPVGWLNTNWRMPTQIIQPWYFGDPYRKNICLWLKGLPPLIATRYATKRNHVHNHVNGRMNQDQKSEVKSSWLWYPNMCNDIVDQWSAVIVKDCDKFRKIERPPLVYPTLAEVSKTKTSKA